MWIERSNKNGSGLREPGTLNDAIKIADRYDTISFKYWKEKFEPVKKFTSNHPYTGPASIDLDTNRYQKLTDKDKNRLKKNQACFYCRQPGHMISACPMKKGKILHTAQAEKHHNSEKQEGELN